MKSLVAGLALAVLAVTQAFAQPSKSTIVLVHGAFADASSWNGVIKLLQDDGYPVVAIANPLRSVKGDADNTRALLATIKSPIVLAGHSYGGMVISNAANGEANVKALVFVAAFAPEAGEAAFELSGKFPGSVLGPALAPPVPLAGGGNDLYVQQDKVHDAFAQISPSLQRNLWQPRNGPLRTRPATSEQPSRLGRACRPGSYTVTKTGQFRRRRTLSWQSARTRETPWWSKAPRTSSWCRIRTWSRKSSRTQQPQPHDEAYRGSHAALRRTARSLPD